MSALLAGIAALLHALPLANYGYLGDELYFIECSKHLAWGYADQPPLVALCALLSAPFGYSLFVLRLFPALAAVGTVWLSTRLVREWGGGTFAALLAGSATMLVPAYLLLGNTLTTTSFEPFSWTLLIYLLVRLIDSRDERYWAGIAATFTFGMYGKYAMFLLAAAVFVGLLATPQRSLLRSRWFFASFAVAATLIAPNAWWQASHGFPFFGVLHGDFVHRHAFSSGVMLEYKDIGLNAAAFLAEQALYTAPLCVPVWIAGLIFVARNAKLRWLGVAYALLLIVSIALAAKGYYIIGIYASLIAAGSVALERILRTFPLRSAAFAVFLIGTVPLLPISLAILPIGTFINYTQMLGLTGRDGTQPKLVQPLYAEEFGWQSLTQSVAAVYNGLPPKQRARTGIFADTYEEAGALAFFGPRYGLPPVIGSHNNFYLWGPGPYDGSSLIVVGATQAETVRKLFRHMHLIATATSPYKWVLQGPDPIYLCTDPIAPLPVIWPQLGWYGA